MVEIIQYERRNSPWVVDIKGAASDESFEISVLRDSNSHGKRSYGWFGKDKLLISHNGGPCHWPVIPQVWDRLVRVAHEVASDLNALDGEFYETVESKRLPQTVTDNK